MKKMTLLLTIVCVGQLYGMEKENDTDINQESMDVENTIGSLPKELQEQITQTAILSSATVDEAITAIKNLNIVFDKLFNNVDDFTKLVLTLADRFKISPYNIAQKFNTPIAKEYLRYYEILNYLAENGGLCQALFIKFPGLAKVDPQILFTISTPSRTRSLGQQELALKKIKLLLDNGANPYAKADWGQPFIEYINQMTKFERRLPPESQFWTKIKSLLEQAIAKKQWQ